MIVRLLVMTGILVATAYAQTAAPPPDAARGFGASGITCSLSGLEANPAGLHRSGSVGGVALAGDPRIAATDVVPVTAVAGVASDVFPLEAIEHDVVLVVADDFGAIRNGGTSVYTLGPAVYVLRYRHYLLTSLFVDIGYSDWLYQRLERLQVRGQISHGALVLTHALDLLASLGATVVEETDDRIVLALGAATVIVQAVEVGGLDASDIADRLGEVMDGYRAQQHTRFVVNMSFTLEPCGAVRRGRRRGAPSLDRYLSATPPTIGPGDPFYDFIHSDVRDTVFVAAAGNFGGDRSRQPGLMPEVTSVSASRGASGELFAQSNHAEVMMAGVWLPLGNPFGRSGLVAPAEALLGGTSLAAPAVAVASVLDLAAEPVRCADAVLGSRLAHGTFGDPSLPVAVDDHCLGAP